MKHILWKVLESVGKCWKVFFKHALGTVENSSDTLLMQMISIQLLITDTGADTMNDQEMEK